MVTTQSCLPGCHPGCPFPEEQPALLSLTVPTLLTDGRREEEEVVRLLPAGMVGGGEDAAFPQLCPRL